MDITAVQTGTVSVRNRQRAGSGPGPLRLLNTLRDRTWTAPLPIYAWVIAHPEGAIVVDTGETARAAEPGYFPRWHPYYRLGVREWVAPEQEIGPQLAALGIAPSDVRRVVMTHLHTDHAGGLHHFPRSEILVSLRELEISAGLAGRLRGYLSNRLPNLFSPRAVEFEDEPLGPFPRSLRLTQAGDVRLVPTPGHTPGHMSVALERDGETVFLAGDTSYTEAHMLAGTVDGVAPDVESARLTLARIRELAGARRLVYLPSHDPDSGTRLAGLVPVGETVEPGAPESVVEGARRA